MLHEGWGRSPPVVRAGAMTATKTTTTTKAGTTTPTEPNVGGGGTRVGAVAAGKGHYSSSSSSTSSSLSALESSEEWSKPPAASTPETCPGEPNLYRLPADLRFTYGPLPRLARLGAWSLSTAAAAVTTARPVMTTWWSSSSPPPPVRSSPGFPWKTIVWTLFKAVVLSLASTSVLQEVLSPPSRVTVRTLMEKYALPSKLSRYERVELPADDETSPSSSSSSLGVHWIECRPPDEKRRSGTRGEERGGRRRYGALYANHGFGASSLSWLPALPSLVNRLGCRVGMGHDAPGFGFTDRPDDVRDYTPVASARIGLGLLRRDAGKEMTPSREKGGEERGREREPVLLMGHSMGCFATLLMALEMDRDVPKDVILVAPPLGLTRRARSPPRGAGSVVDGGDDENATTTETKTKTRSGTILRAAWRLPTSYALRRVVGAGGFWRKGLSAAWGDPRRLSDADVLRFQWPSVGRGWEGGLLNFARAMQRKHPYKYDDRELVRRVSDLPRTNLHVVFGSEDPVVRPKSVRRFFRDFPEATLAEIPGLGHDPFEEDVDLFVDAVRDLLDEND